MEPSKNNMLLEQLSSKQFKKRLGKGRLFEQLGGGGIFKKIQRVILTPGIYLPYVFYAKSGLARNSFFTTSLFWGRSISIPLRDYDSLTLHMFGFAGGNEGELKLAKFFIKNTSSTDVFYDIGANCGFYTYLASELCKETHAFEPIPVLIETIEKNSVGYSGVTVNRTAVSEKNGSIDFYVGEFSGLSTLNSDVIDGRTPQSGTFKKTTTPTVTLDTYVATHSKPTFLKIDAEGAEKRIIEGGKNFFSTNSPVIAMEVWGEQGGGAISMEAVEELRKMGYRSYFLNPEGEIEEATGNLSLRVAATGADNFIFKK